MRPFLKWAGGKKQLLPIIKKFLNEETLSDSMYYEPFIGGGSVLFSLNRTNVVINDLNEEIINAYMMIKEHPIALIRMLKTHEKKHCHEYYYKIREQDRNANFSKMGKVKKAARTIYLNKTCFNGLYRVNSNGYFNTPIGKYTNPLICDKDNILEISKYLNLPGVSILNTDFEKAVTNYKAGDYIYFDPPYDYENEDGFAEYTPNSFDRNDLKRLKKFSDKLINDGCKVLISNNDTSFVRELFKDKKYKIIYKIHPISAKRTINSNAKLRNEGREVLIYGQLEN